MKAHTAFSNWKFVHIPLKFLELLPMKIVGI